MRQRGDARAEEGIADFRRQRIQHTIVRRGGCPPLRLSVRVLRCLHHPLSIFVHHYRYTACIIR